MTATERAFELVRAAAAAAAEKQASDLIAFDVSDQLAITDVFSLCSANSQPQLQAVKEEIEDALLKLGAKTLRREGERDSRWILMDYGDIVVHIQHTEERAFYALERLWNDCPAIDLKLS